MELEFIQISGPKSKNEFLQHITELIQIPLTVDDTYNTLFDKLITKVESKTTTEQQAIQDWIDFNLAEQDDKTVFETKLVDQDNQYAIFNLKHS